MFYMFGTTDIFYYMILVLPAFVLALIAQSKVKSTYKKMSTLYSKSGYTGAQAAAAVLRFYNITDVQIEKVAGKLSDHYDPRTKVIRLSEGVFGSNSVAAIGIACHEAGHAAQHAEKYVPVSFRNAIVPVANIGSYMAIPLALIGFWLGNQGLVFIGLGLYSLIAVFQLVTLPVEFNASSRAIKVIDETGLLRSDEEISGAKKVLTAAAMTYIAALAVTLANLLRFILIFGRRR